jgi:DNA-directed RNA polymerase specialized sigma24 family protein
MEQPLLVGGALALSTGCGTPPGLNRFCLTCLCVDVMADDRATEGTCPASGLLPTTHWTEVLAAKNPSETRAREAFAWLCEVYWRPLYVYLRRKGNDSEGAEDLVQGFFTHLLSRSHHWFSQVDRTQGRFRTYLLGAVDFYVRDQWQREMAGRRSGGKRFLFIDAQDEERHWESLRQLSPLEAYEKRWALALLERVMRLLQREYQERGKSACFEMLCPHLLKEAGAETYAEAGRKLGLSEGAVTQEVRRMKERYGRLVRSEIQETVGSPTEVDDELRHLMEILGK